jgi:MoxR-like ATPase
LTHTKQLAQNGICCFVVGWLGGEGSLPPLDPSKEKEMSTSAIVSRSNELVAAHTKGELVIMAKSVGWRGDYARALTLQLAIFIATKEAEGAHPQDPRGNSPLPAGQGEGGGFAPVPAAQEPTKEPETLEEIFEQWNAEQAAKNAAQSAGQEAPQKAQEAPQEAPQGSDQGESNEAPQEAPQAPQEAAQQPTSQEAPQAEPEPEEEPLPADADEFLHLLKKSGIKTPHRLLRKLWTVAVKGGMNVMLVGPAASGKTTLSSQLAQLVRLPFVSISCSMGMSENQLTGWLLPVGQGGAYEYVASPFVKNLQMPSVTLIDEMDGADANVLLVANSALANGFIEIQHKLNGSKVMRHPKSIIVAGCNTVGMGADELYAARSALDASTVDRFYIMVVDYDEAYEDGIFVMPGEKPRRRSAQWEPNKNQIEKPELDSLKAWFKALRRNVTQAGISRIVSTRLAQKLVAAVLSGVPASEAKKDLLTGWSDDEIRRAKVEF